MPIHAAHVKLKSALRHNELERRMEGRAPQFRAIEGLEQKYYLADPEDGWHGGSYTWRSLANVAVYRESEPAAAIAAAYNWIGRPESTFDEIITPLRT